MTIENSSAKSTIEPISQCGIPEIMRGDLNAVGGVKGLCEHLPSPEYIEEISSLHHALSDPIRIKILSLLTIQPLCVCVIRECIGISGSKLTYHLNILKESGLIYNEPKGNWIMYHLTEKGKKYLQGIALLR